MAKLTVPVNAGGSSGPLENKVYKKVGQTKITLKEKIEDLKNWYYEDSNPHILDVPKWNDIPFESSQTLFYMDDVNNIRMSYYVDGTTKYLIIMDVGENQNNYRIYSEDYSSYEANKWYDNSYEIVDTPQFELDKTNLSWDISYGPEPYEALFDAIYGTEQVLLKDKFADVYRAIDENVDDSILKTKLYDNGVTELENNKTYQFKEDCSDFFTSFSLSGSAPIEIYYKNIEIEPDDPTPSMSTNSSSGIRLMSTNNANQEEEEVLSIACGVENGQKGIAVGTFSNQYLFLEGNNGWTPSTPPDLVVDEQYVKNADMLKALLQGGQTLEQKFNEEIKNWNYSKGKAENKPLFDVTNVFPTVFNLFGQANLLPSNNSSVSNVILYLEPNKFTVRYSCTRTSSKYMVFIEWVDVANNETIYGCSISAGSTFSFTWISGIIESGNNQPTFTTPIASQEELPSFIYNTQYVSQGINPEIITNLITTFTPKITLEEKVNDLKNWFYEEKELDSSALKPVFDTATVILNNMQTFGQAGMFSNVTNEVLYSQNELEVYWTFDDGTITIAWKVPNEDEQLYNVYENIIQEESNLLASSWDCYTQPFDFVQGDAYSVTPINSQEELPEITIDETLIETGYEDILPLLYENVKSMSKITLKDKFESCLTLTRLFNITIPSTSITEANNNDYSLTPYSYIWKITLEDDAFKDALKIETIFDLDEITPENICPFQDIDTENGTLTLYVKEKSDIVISRIDIFKNNK